MTKHLDWLGRALAKAIVALVALILSPLIFLGVVAYGFYWVVLRVFVWLVWCRDGSRVFVCYSDSPHWKDRFEQHLLPLLPSSAIVINWSESARWSRWSLRRAVFEHFLGTIDHTPSVIVFRLFRRPQLFRFAGAYKSYKRGEQSAVIQLESALLEAVGSNYSLKR